MNGCCGPEFEADETGRRNFLRMGRRGTSLACTLMVAATSTGTARGEVRTAYPALLQDIVLERVPSTDVYYTIGHYAVPDQRNEGHTSNAGFVVTSEGVVVFDALGTPSLGWALLQKIREVTDQPVRYVVISHYHADHIYGLQAFRDHTDAVILAQDTARSYADPANNDELAAPRLEQRRAALAPWVNETTRIVQPSRTFASEAGFELGGQRFRIVYAGPAHSSSDAMMLVEPAGILFAGDIVQAGRIPFMASAAVDTNNWLRGLDEVGAMQPRTVLPGHGPLSSGAAAAIAFTQGYIHHVRTAMAQAVADWVEFDAAYQQTDWSAYQAIPAFASSNRGNAYRVYLEMQAASLQSGAGTTPALPR